MYCINTLKCFLKKAKPSFILIPLVASLLFLISLGYTLNAQNLPKRHYNAFAVSVPPDSTLKRLQLKSGLLVSRVLPNGSAANTGVQSGDIVLSLNGISLTSLESLRNGKLASLREGNEIIYKVYRNGKIVDLKGVSVGRPSEAAADLDYQYGSVQYGKGLLRSVISSPRYVNGANFPAILFIQGYPCTEIVGIDSLHPYRRLTDGLSRAGYKVMRVEKPGLGDCLNTPSCSEISFPEEYQAFEAALLALKKDPSVDTSKIFIWGHSLGGMIAPMLTSQYNWIKGAVVYGTVSRVWSEYLLYMTRLQQEGFGVPPVEVEKTVRAVKKIVYEVYTQKKAPSQLVKENPELKEVLEQHFGWDAATDQLFTRSLLFNQGLDEVNPALLWSKTSSKVLAIYGEADVEAVNPEGTLAIVNTVNHYHPGNASYHFLKRTDHAFASIGTIEDGYRSKMDPNYASIMIQNFNPEVIHVSTKWLNQIAGDKPTTSIQKSLEWKKLNTVAYPGKQDDIFFINEQRGWYVNGAGNIYRTNNGGTTWEKSFSQPGTFFRCIAFIDSLIGFAGNVGTDYFPNVKDTIPLYKTTDGGKTWKPVSYQGPYVKGLCAIDIVKEQYINHGKIDYKYHIYAVGRVGSPATMMVSNDGGNTFTSWSMQGNCKMLFDIKMFNKNEGFVCAASSEDLAESNALILYTADGGKTWEKRYQSNRPFETTWKASFPTNKIGYVTIQSYNPDPLVKQQRIAKTVDGGKTWTEYNLVEDAAARTFGIGFIDENHGFVGTTNSGYETTDGGKTWKTVNIGRAANKFRIHQRADGSVYGYSIGVDVFKLQ